VGKREAAEAAALDTELSGILWSAQKGDEVPRIVRVPLVNRGRAYELSGAWFPDGKTRCAVNPRERVDEAATIAKMDRMDEERNRG